MTPTPCSVNLTKPKVCFITYFSLYSVNVQCEGFALTLTFDNFFSFRWASSGATPAATVSVGTPNTGKYRLNIYIIFSVATHMYTEI